MNKGIASVIRNQAQLVDEKILSADAAERHNLISDSSMLWGLAVAVDAVTEGWSGFRRSYRRSAVEHLRCVYLLRDSISKFATRDHFACVHWADSARSAGGGARSLDIMSRAFDYSMWKDVPLLALDRALIAALAIDYEGVDAKRWLDPRDTAFYGVVEGIRAALPAVARAADPLPEELSVPEILALPQFQSDGAISRRHMYYLAERGQIDSRLLPDGRRLCRVESALAYRRKRYRG